MGNVGPAVDMHPALAPGTTTRLIREGVADERRVPACGYAQTSVSGTSFSPYRHYSPPFRKFCAEAAGSLRVLDEPLRGRTTYRNGIAAQQRTVDFEDAIGREDSIRECVSDEHTGLHVSIARRTSLQPTYCAFQMCLSANGDLRRTP
jgi:hypothetical protein